MENENHRPMSQGIIVYTRRLSSLLTQNDVSSQSRREYNKKFKSQVI